MPSIECKNEECGTVIDVELSNLDCKSNGLSGNHTTFYTYTGVISCPECEQSHDVEYLTDESDETGDINSTNRI